MTGNLGRASALVLSIYVAKAGSLDTTSEAKLTKVTEKYAKDVFSEASHFESGQRGRSSSVQQITARHIQDGDDAVRKRSYLRPSTQQKILSFISEIFLVMAGIVGGISGSTLAVPGPGTYWFAASVFVALASLGYLHFGRSTR